MGTSEMWSDGYVPKTRERGVLAAVRRWYHVHDWTRYDEWGDDEMGGFHEWCWKCDERQGFTHMSYPLAMFATSLYGSPPTIEPASAPTPPQS